MGPTTRAVGAIVLTATWLAGSGRPAAAGQRGARDDLAGLLTSLHLTGAGTEQWLDRLAPAGRTGRPAHERLIAVTVDGATVAIVDGTARRVPLGRALDARCLQPGAGIVLVHNHPHSLGLSADDLSQLAKPGVAAVVAIGLDGSLYAAAAARRFPGDAFRDLIYAPALAEAGQQMRHERAGLAEDDPGGWMPHLMGLALAEAGVIEYRATLAPDRQAAFDRDRPALGRVIAVAEYYVRRRLRARGSIRRVHKVRLCQLESHIAGLLQRPSGGMMRTSRL